MVKFVGSHTNFEWVETGYYSLDLALRRNYLELGFPSRTLTEVYGPTSIGKSTFINSVAGTLGKLKTLNIACLDLEPQAEETIAAICETVGFDGEWKWVEPSKVDKHGAFTDEHLLKELLKNVKDNYITILDSVASVAPVSEIEGDIGDANMGRRAFPMAQFSRGMNRALKYSDEGTFSFMANHKYEKMATRSMFAVYTAPGGVVKENMCHIRIEAKNPWIKLGTSNKLAHFGEGWLFEGKILKNRGGISKTDFWVFMIGGQGIHKGLTALFDCVKLKLVKVGGSTIKNMSVALKDGTGEIINVYDAVKERDSFDFMPFFSALKNHQLSAEDDAKAIENAKEEDDVVFVDISGEEDEE
jgi:recombination protein RecA